MSSIGVMFAPHHQAAADELVRVCRRGGTIGLMSWTPEGMIGELFATMKPFAPPPPPGASAPPLWGSEEHLQDLIGGRVEFRHARARRARDHRVRARPRLRRALQGELRPDDRGPRERGEERPEAEFDAALDAFCDKWNRSAPGEPARFEKEYLLAVGTRR